MCQQASWQGNHVPEQTLLLGAHEVKKMLDIMQLCTVAPNKSPERNLYDSRSKEVETRVPFDVCHACGLILHGH